MSVQGAECRGAGKCVPEGAEPLEQLFKGKEAQVKPGKQRDEKPILSSKIGKQGGWVYLRRRDL